MNQHDNPRRLDAPVGLESRAAASGAAGPSAPASAAPLRILHLSAMNLWGMAGNAGMCCLYETLRGHVRAGYQVAIIIPAYDLWDNGRTPLEKPESPEFEVHQAPCRWLPAVKTLRAWATRLGGGRETPYVLRWGLGMVTWSLTTVSLFAAAMKLIWRGKRRFDIVYAHNEYAAIAGWLVHLACRIPNVTRLYGTFVTALMGRPLVALRYPVAAGGFLVPHSRLICANDGTRGDEAARKFRLDLGRFRFWQDGVDRSPPDLSATRAEFAKSAPANLRTDARWALSCSRLSYWKRIDRMVRALAVARRAGAAVQLLVAGDGPEKEPLAKLAAELGVADDIVWLGPVPHDRIWQLMSLVDVFMITNDVTNRCNPLFEAIRADLPVVSVLDPSTKDLLVDGENALLADRDDTDRLGRCLARLCSDAALVERMKQAQRSRDALLWTWEERMEVEVRDLADLAAEGRRLRRA